MDDAVAEGSGEDFSDDGLSGDEGDAAGGNVGAIEDGVAEVDEVFESVHFEDVFVAGGALALAGGEVGFGEFLEEPVAEGERAFGEGGDVLRGCEVFGHIYYIGLFLVFEVGAFDVVEEVDAVAPDASEGRDGADFEVGKGVEVVGEAAGDGVDFCPAGRFVGEAGVHIEVDDGHAMGEAGGFGADEVAVEGAEFADLFVGAAFEAADVIVSLGVEGDFGADDGESLLARGDEVGAEFVEGF